MSGFPQSTIYNRYIWISIPLKRFDENTAVYGISGILPSTNIYVLKVCTIQQYNYDRIATGSLVWWHLNCFKNFKIHTWHAILSLYIHCNCFIRVIDCSIKVRISIWKFCVLAKLLEYSCIEWFLETPLPLAVTGSKSANIFTAYTWCVIATCMSYNMHKHFGLTYYNMHVKVALHHDYCNLKAWRLIQLKCN